MNRFFVLLLGLFSALLLTSLGAPYFHPKTIPFLPFIGLLFPIWTLLTLILTLGLYFKKNRFYYWGIFMLLVCSSFLIKIVGLTFFEFSSPKSPIKLMSYNVRLFGLYDDSTTETRDKIFQFIRTENPDIAFFQEYYRQDKPTKFVTYDSISAILKSKDYHERSAHNNKGHRNFGVSIFSRFPMIARGDVMFESQGLMDFNFCIFADIVANHDTFRVYNVHLQSIRLSEPGNKSVQPGFFSNLRIGMRKMRIAYEKRADQARKVLEHMESSPYPVILCGDFNDTPISYTYEQFNKSLSDAFLASSWGLGSTYIGKIPAGRIDYIFHSESISSYKFKVHNVSYSDHRPITCQIQLNQE